MSEYWKSVAKHHCGVCNVWLSGHPRNVAAHNASEVHKGRKESTLKRLAEEEREKAAAAQHVQDTLRAIEGAALASMQAAIQDDVLFPDPSTFVPGPDGLQSSGLPPPAKPWSATTKPTPAEPVRPPPRDYRAPNPMHQFVSEAQRERDKGDLADFIRNRLLDRKTTTSRLPPAGPAAEKKGAYVTCGRADAAASVSDDDVDLSGLDPTFYGAFEELPDRLQKSRRAQNVGNWVEELHETTGLPVYFNALLNVKLWVKPEFPEHTLRLRGADPPESGAASGSEALSGTQGVAVQGRSKEPTEAEAGSEPGPKSLSTLPPSTEPPVKPPWTEAPSEESEEMTLEAIMRRARQLQTTHGAAAGAPGQWQVVNEGEQVMCGDVRARSVCDDLGASREAVRESDNIVDELVETDLERRQYQQYRFGTTCTGTGTGAGVGPGSRFKKRKLVKGDDEKTVKGDDEKTVEGEDEKMVEDRSGSGAGGS
ncbi:hypothetical protein GNI_070270 [Gregarina niphandrodes]|uniref:U1-type domain-containing protein n=1 Tax=Gregarina niphandrodes TaxID=110365 RepID=A0A023B7D6_GRENI|nr:hypothetical protein GNI_070270 [Gregarina niphandrodes]EZG67241.1 hypothetical protein GNI_070270 [Gregarina niphandrodes]|eukprot:XP_011130286.1 hypothetical protein GNI_070270 [Gregarina niphandrodes]